MLCAVLLLADCFLCKASFELFKARGISLFLAFFL